MPTARHRDPSTEDYIFAIADAMKLVAQRLIRYAGLVGKHNLIATSDCGFGRRRRVGRGRPQDRLSETSRHGPASPVQ